VEQTTLDIFDFLLPPFYLLIIFFYARSVVAKNVNTKSHYKYLLPALICKVVGGIGLCLVYTFYYTEGGDVVNYFLSTTTYVNVLLQGHFSKFFEMLDYKENNIWAILSYSNSYGYFLFAPTDYYALFTVSITIPFCLLAFKSFIATTILLSSFSFIGLWKLYEVFIDQFPTLKRQFAISIFFIPSVFFWGSGILKDTYTLSSIGFFIFGLYNFQILKKRKVKYFLMILISAIVFINIKPYYLFALLPGSLLWIFFNRIQRISNQFLKVTIIPFVLVVLFAAVILIFNNFGSYLGEYSLDKILSKAVKTQQDLVRSAYGSNSYNIGEFDASIGSIITKVPAALNLALFRPYIWDARNPVMVLSGLENLFMLGFSIYIVIRVKFSILLRSLFSHPLLIFSFLFSLFFAFSVGLTTANYGALARLKIPCIPFYLSSLFILYSLNKESFKRK